MNFKLFFIFLLCILLSFGLGVGYGAVKIAEKLMDIATDVLDIDLTPQARAILINQPELMSYAIKNYKNVTNPFIASNERLQFDRCMLSMGNETLCYKGMLSKYGNHT